MQRDLLAALVPQEELEEVVEADNSSVALKIEAVIVVMANDALPKQLLQSAGVFVSESSDENPQLGQSSSRLPNLEVSCEKKESMAFWIHWRSTSKLC